MGRTFPNLDAVRVTQAGYYFNEKLMKLARLQVGEKLPNGVGPWEFLAADHVMSSSQVVDRLRKERPALEFDRLTYTVRSPLDRRLPLGDPPRLVWSRLAAVAVGFLALGLFLSRLRDRYA